MPKINESDARIENDLDKQKLLDELSEKYGAYIDAATSTYYEFSDDQEQLLTDTLLNIAQYYYTKGYLAALEDMNKKLEEMKG